MAFDSVSADRIGFYGGPPTNPGRKVFPQRGTPGQNAMDRELGKNGCPGGTLSGVGGDHHSENAGVPDGDRDV